MALSFDERDKLNFVHSGQTLRSYVPMDSEKADPKNTKDFKECFDFGKHSEDASPFSDQNRPLSERVQRFQEADQNHP